MALPGSEVHQTLKSAPLFLLCAAVNEHPPSPCPRSRSLDDATSEVTSVEELYERLGCFPAHELGVLVDAQARTMTTFSRSQSPRDTWRNDTLLVLHKGCNTASRITEPFWCWIQYRCRQACRFPIQFPTVIAPADFHLPNEFCLRQTRRMLTKWISTKKCPVVTNIWRCPQSSISNDRCVMVLIIITGNSLN